MIDDDLVRIAALHPGECGLQGARPHRITTARAARILAAAIESTGARLAGASPTGNPFYSRQPLSTRHFVIASMILVQPSEPRFDPGFRLKEDYDFTAAHLDAYGTVARVDRLLPTFRHYTNSGGCQPYRDLATEQAAVARLQTKWPGVFRDNPRRPGEVIMRWPARP